MTRTNIFQDGIIRVTVDNDGDIVIEKCEKYDNFEHGSDWEMPLDDVDEAKALVRLLQEAISIADARKPPVS